MKDWDFRSAMEAWAFVDGQPPAVRGSLRTQPEDFQVDEVLGFEPGGSGDYLYLLVEKRGANTEHVAERLADHAGVRRRDVGYAGMKDRNAVTRQWFSLRTPAAGVDSDADNDEFRILRVARHHTKLNPGDLDGNRFLLRIREIQGTRTALETAIERARLQGVPNYFGPQRFGHGGENLGAAMELFSNRRVKINQKQRGIYLSAARSFLFNEVLSERVRESSWNELLPGEAVMQEGTDNYFRTGPIAPILLERAARHEIHPSGPLWGRGRPVVSGAVAAIERRILTAYEPLKSGLECAGLVMTRRALRLFPEKLEYRWVGEDAVEIGFELPSGTYATSVMRELVRSAEGEGAMSLEHLAGEQRQG